MVTNGKKNSSRTTMIFFTGIDMSKEKDSLVNIFQRFQQPAVQAFSLCAQFARESVMLNLPEERRRWGESRGAGRGRGERRENACPKTL